MVAACSCITNDVDLKVLLSRKVGKCWVIVPVKSCVDWCYLQAVVLLGKYIDAVNQYDDYKCSQLFRFTRYLKSALSTKSR